MTAKTTRILKEARTLFWPWCVVIVAGVLRLVEQSHFGPMGGGLHWGVHQLIEPISFLGFFFGIPLLAALSFGNEFQHRTLPLLLSQPVRRMEIWGEKLSVMIVAVVSAALVFGMSWRGALQQEPELWLLARAGIIATIASATFWTLLARSTMGGFALNTLVNSLMPLGWFALPVWFPQTAHFLPPRTMPARWAAAFALLCYSGVMLWLGGRKLARFQVTGGLAGEDLLMAGQGVMPVALAEWFRCRPTGAVANLIRKELRLLRPVWLISMLAVPVWICLPLFGYTLKRGSVPAALMVVAIIPLIAVLAGTMSLGEERTSGTHSWHMTLPMPASRQWLIKLVTAMFAGVVCSALLPVLVQRAGGFLFGWPQMFESRDAEMAWLLTIALLSFASFWCAGAVNGTVRAALWVFPVLIALLLAGRFGEWVASGPVDFVVSRFDLFTNFRFTNAVSNIPLFDTGAPPVLFVLLVPTLTIAVIQSSLLFRKQLQDSALFVVRRLLPLAITAFLCGFSLLACFLFVDQAKQQMWKLFRETHEAIEKVQPGTPNLDAAHPLQLTLEDLAKAAPLSERTQRWLRNSRISLAPNKSHPGATYCCGGNSRSITFASDKAYSWYLATIQLPSGSECTVAFEAGRGYGLLGGVCK